MRAAAQPSDLADRIRGPASLALLVAVGAATCIALLVGGGDLVLVLAPVTLVTLLYAMAKAPLRWSVAMLLLLVLSLDMTSDAAGVWHTPLAPIGDLLQRTVTQSLGIPGIPLSGAELVALYLLAVAAYRNASRSRAHSSEELSPTVGGIREFLFLYVAGIVFADVNGLVRGAGVGLYKLHHLVEIPLYFLLFDRALRGPADHALIGRVVVFAGCVKALLAIVVQHFVAPALTGGKLAHATNHGDSVLFALATLLLIANCLERADARSFRRALAFVPLLLLGMMENNRRTVWVMLILVLGATYLLSPRRPWKRALTRFVLVAAPLVALYAAVGWNRSGTIFAPLATLRTLTDATVDSSTFWRDVENWNIAMSMRDHPLLGVGLGQEYTEYMKGDDISAVFEDFRAWPHNSVLGLLLFAGPFAFTAIWALFGFTVFLGVRAYRWAERPDDRVAALGCVAATIVCAVLAYSDTGAYHTQYRLFCALALAVAGKLAVATGAWREAAGRGVRRGEPSLATADASGGEP